MLILYFVTYQMRSRRLGGTFEFNKTSRATEPNIFI